MLSRRITSVQRVSVEKAWTSRLTACILSMILVCSIRMKFHFFDEAIRVISGLIMYFLFILLTPGLLDIDSST